MQKLFLIQFVSSSVSGVPSSSIFAMHFNGINNYEDSTEFCSVVYQVVFNTK